NPTTTIEVHDFRHDLFAPGRACELQVAGELLGYLGEVRPEVRKKFDLREGATAAEVRVAALEKIAALVPRAFALSEFPAISRDLNLVVDERVRWADLEATVKAAAGADLERINYRDTYRDPQRLGPGKKSQLLTVLFRRSSGTLSGTEADQIRDQIVA